MFLGWKEWWRTSSRRTEVVQPEQRYGGFVEKTAMYLMARNLPWDLNFVPRDNAKPAKTSQSIILLSREIPLPA